ncbi:MAG: hypothetical protein AMJ45_07250 [Syntrophobacter sp. DG_60]|nr:MAG: hypothetical protein AMJ45_07250 [Syntrophobacter sp. DG_60]
MTYTIKELFRKSVKKYPKAIFLEMWNGKGYEQFSYQSTQALLEKLGAGLIKLGINKGEKIILLAENSPAWVVCFLAIVSGGWVVVPLDKELKPKEICKLIEFSDAKVIFVSPSLFHKLEPLKLKNFGIYFVDDLKSQEAKDSSLASLMKAEGFIEKYNSIQLNEDDLASIIFTSGTTGAAKGVMLTHKNFVSDVISSCDRIKIKNSDSMFLILPLHHTFPLTAGLLLPMYKGARIVIENNKKRILKTMQERRPTYLLGVPKLFQLLYEAMASEAKKQGKEKLWLKGISLSRKVKQLTGINIGRIIFRGLHKNMGGNIKLFVSGGAPLPPSLAQKYSHLGIHLLQGWGMTELSPVGTVLSFSRWRFYFSKYYENRFSSIGPPIQGLKIKLIDNPRKNLYTNLGGEGELVVSGPMLTPGYYKDESANSSSFISIGNEVWFKTGDIGKMDNEGNFYITGRDKYIIVTPDGKNVYPEEVEEVLNQSPLIQESLVLGRKASQGEEIVAIISPDVKNLSKFLEENGIPFNWGSIYGVIYKEMQAVLKDISSYKWPSDFALTHYNEDGFEIFEKTTTLKIRREFYKFPTHRSYYSVKKGGWRRLFFEKL